MASVGLEVANPRQVSCLRLPGGWWVPSRGGSSWCLYLLLPFQAPFRRAEPWHPGLAPSLWASVSLPDRRGHLPDRHPVCPPPSCVSSGRATAYKAKQQCRDSLRRSLGNSRGSGFELAASEDYNENGGDMVISGKLARPWRWDRMPGEEPPVNKE